MKKIAIVTDQAPAAIGPYTQALAVGPFVFVSGQIPVDPQGNVVPGDIVVQTCQVIANLKAIPLTVAGTACMDFAAFHIAHGWGWLATGVSLVIIEHLIADEP